MTTFRIIDRKHEGTQARFTGGVQTVAKGDRRHSPEGQHGRWVAAVVRYLAGKGRLHALEQRAFCLPERMREANWCRDSDPGPPAKPARGTSDLTTMGAPAADRKAIRQAQKNAWRKRRIAAGQCVICSAPSGGPNLCPACNERRRRAYVTVAKRREIA